MGTAEARAGGLTGVAKRNAGSVVRDGVAGFTVPIRDVEALAAARERLRSEEWLRREMGRAARVRAKEFTWERYGDAIAEAYQQRVMLR